jgi:hypothetical protein
MSYGFDFTVESKAAAKERLNAELAKVMEHQPVHAKDVPSVVVLANDTLDLLQAEDKDVRVQVYGSVSYSGSQESPVISAVNASITISSMPRPVPDAKPA